MAARWTRRWMVMAATAAIGAAPVAARQARGEAEAMDAFDEGLLRLDLTLEQDGGYLLAAYRLANAGKVPVVVFDRLFVTDPAGGRTVDPDLCWRWVDAGGTYVMAKLVPSVPRGMRVESPEVPYARPLPAGGEVQGRALVPYPLDQHLPYDQTAPVPSASEVSGVQLLLGYAAVDPDFAYTEIDTPEGAVLSVRPPWARTRHRVLRSAVVEGRLALARG